MSYLVATRQKTTTFLLIILAVCFVMFLLWPDYGKMYDYDCTHVSGDIASGGECSLRTSPDRSDMRFGGGARELQNTFYSVTVNDGSYSPHADRMFMTQELLGALVCVSAACVIVWVALGKKRSRG